MSMKFKARIFIFFKVQKNVCKVIHSRVHVSDQIFFKKHNEFGID